MKAVSPARAEAGALALAGLFLAALLLTGPIAQPQDYHCFADARPLAMAGWLLPNAANVLSNLGFLAVGLAGLACCAGVRPPQRLPLALLFAGLGLTGLGSAWYHLAPTDASLVWDRWPMALGFAGALGALASERLGPAAGRRWLAGWLLLGMLGVGYWAGTGDLRLYMVAQFGGLIALLLWLRLPSMAGMRRLPWGWLVVGYGLAKGCELFDREIWNLTDGALAGHAAKHLFAAFGVLPLVGALRRSPAAAPAPGGALP